MFCVAATARQCPTRHGQTVYSSAAVLAAERRILAAADCGDGRVAEDADIALALLEGKANGRPLNDGQRALVRDGVVGARVQPRRRPGRH